ncbi:MAG: hypothetical protein M0P49_01820 [Bacilli bacterium]|nr:hypothetical protein [Bacilli bacterium]
MEPNIVEVTKIPLLTENYTRFSHEKDYKFNTPHHFIVQRVSDDEVIAKIDFQEGPIKENGVNGVANEDLLGMILIRLIGLQNSEFKCEENAKAINLIEETLKTLRSRTNKRIERGVIGTSIV